MSLGILIGFTIGCIAGPLVWELCKTKNTPVRRGYYQPTAASRHRRAAQTP